MAKNFILTPELREELKRNCEILQEYIQNPKQIDPKLRVYFSRDSWAEAKEIVAEECRQLIDFINLALEKTNARILLL